MRALESARLQAREGFHDWSCFLAEQAAQLAVKGPLHGIGSGRARLRHARLALPAG
ncbi:MAG: HEPN domain-containing protein [Solirubrobacterales bacterium]